MHIFSRYLVIPQYFYFKYRGMIFVNTAHPYFYHIHTLMYERNCCEVQSNTLIKHSQDKTKSFVYHIYAASYTHRGSNTHWILQQNKVKKCLGPFKCQVPQLLNLINSNIVLCIKKNECILDISLNMCIFLSEIATVNHLQPIFMTFVVFLHWCAYTFVNKWGPYTFINALAYNHTIKLNTDAGTCLSTLNR